MRITHRLLLSSALILAASCSSDDGDDPSTVNGSTSSDTVASDSSTGDDSMTADDTSASDDASASNDASEGDDAGTAPDDIAEEDTAPPKQWPPAPNMVGTEDRPATYYLPKAYTHDEQWPLVVLLHGYSANGFLQDIYLGLSAIRDDYGFLVVTPDGTKNSEGAHFWNATNACCNFEGSSVDDVGYITGLVDDMSTYFNVDPSRVYLLGHSNGGFMSYRLACEVGDRFAGIMSLAGSAFGDPEDCDSPTPLTVLQVHGTEDETIDYNGGTIGGGQGYPSAEEAVARWVERNGCGEPEPDTTADIDTGLEGEETTVKRWTGCSSGFEVALWTIDQGAHLPTVTSTSFTGPVLEYLFQFSRPE